MRKACPRGHRSWEPRSTGYYCNQCEARFRELIDLKNEEPDPYHRYNGVSG